ncbi:ileal sodium/bile acid cotransporter-like [Rhopalosiphum padi]|uniref:ileal sodium/bile acid cotransporter-like n=1 Tax=Rhopalosiphum padi TaxID=40932 RepID=UPI00298E8825|nr:ileal sodium/bile acid cotransporter-like [Rhopalosiphum padi]
MLRTAFLLNLCVATCFTTSIAANDWIFTFNNTDRELEMGSCTKIVFYAQTNASWENEDFYLQVISSDEDVAYPSRHYFELPQNNTMPSNSWKNSFNLTSEFLGYTKLYFQVVKLENNTYLVLNSSDVHMNIKVIRKPQLIDKIFVICVAVLMTIIFINLGCALDVEQLKLSVRKPIAPAVSFFAQFLILPILSFFYAKLIFPNSVSMQLGLFFTGISPGGGASSVWSLLLDGNINLSIVLTTIGTLESFIMIPFWIVFLGKRIFSVGEMPVPYSRIGFSIIALIIPLCIGYCIQRFMPRVSRVMTRILKPLSSCLIIFIIIFATVTNLYLFKIFSWKIILAGAVIPWTGYLIGLITSMLACLPTPDIISMTVESGIQNTGIAIFMLKFSLGQPAADITTVIPVAVALMTPIPLLIAFIIKKCFGKKDGIVNIQDPATESMLNKRECEEVPPANSENENKQA